SIKRPAWLTLMGVENVLSYQDLSGVPGLRAAARFPLRSGTLTLWHNDRFRGMGFAAPRPVSARSDSGIADWHDSLYASALLAKAPAADPASAITVQSDVARNLQSLPLAEKIDDRFKVEQLPAPPNEFRFRTSYPAPALLCLAQSAYDGWSARI